MKRFQLKHPIWFSILFAAAELALLNLISIPILLGLMAAGHEDAGAFTDGSLSFLYSALVEGATAVLVLAAAWFLHHRALLWRKGCAWGKGFISAIFPLILIAVIAATSFAGNWGHSRNPPWAIAWFVVYMASIGVLEETTFRGVIAETLLFNFGTDGRAVWKAALLSSLMFGLVHLQNMMAADAASTVLQVIFAFCFGMLLVSVYFRTGNLWIPILLHAAWDFAALVPVGIYGVGSMTATESPNAASVVENLVLAAICLIPVPFLLARKKMPQVSQYFGGEILALREGVAADEEKKRREMEEFLARVGRPAQPGAAVPPYVSGSAAPDAVPPRPGAMPGTAPSYGYQMPNYSGYGTYPVYGAQPVYPAPGSYPYGMGAGMPTAPGTAPYGAPLYPPYGMPQQAPGWYGARPAYPAYGAQPAAPVYPAPAYGYGWQAPAAPAPQGTAPAPQPFAAQPDNAAAPAPQETAPAPQPFAAQPDNAAAAAPQEPIAPAESPSPAAPAEPAEAAVPAPEKAGQPTTDAVPAPSAEISDAGGSPAPIQPETGSAGDSDHA